METLNALYAQFLHVGFIVLRQAIHARNFEWVEAEAELLHNVPSLINEPNVKRHEYFWYAERTHYREWVSAPGREIPKSRMMTFYEPLWKEMEPVLLALLKGPENSLHRI